MSDRKHQYEITTELTLREMIHGAFIMREREDELNEPKFLTYNHHRIDKLIGTTLVQGTWCSWLSRSLSIGWYARGVRFDPGRVHFVWDQAESATATSNPLILIFPN